MKYAEVEAPHQIRIKEIRTPIPGAHEVLVRVSLCGIDWPTFKHVINGEDTTYPANGFNNLNLAHEASGEIVSIGQEVKHFKVGDRVTYFGPGFQEYAVVKADYCCRIPNGLEYLELLGEPMAVMYHSAERCQPNPRKTIVVFGAGYMGLGIIHFLTRLGVQTIIAVETNAYRLHLAGEMGASLLVNPSSQDPIEKILSYTNNKGADLAIEATGSDQVLNRIELAVRTGGDIVIHGWFGGERKIRLDKWHAKDLTVSFAHPAPAEIYGKLIEKAGRMVAEGKIDLTSLVTHQVPFNEIENLEAIIKGSDNYLKGVVIL
ncbi:MAG: zinc-binding dehydrogenase [Chloroflexi bacterium]|nr:zinc-binding dehydrogenase [Chloroflexota bacterium]